MLSDNRRMFQAVAALACFSTFAATAQTTLPRVIATGTRTDGVDIRCFGGICADTLRSVEMMIMMAGEFEQLDGEVQVDKRQFCANLKTARPPGCSMIAPPSAPGYDPAYVGNGCGDGSFKSYIANELVSHVVWGYSGNLDHPLPGVSFYSACQVHDYCYASGRPRDTCDQGFGASLLRICEGANASHQSSCSTLSSIYRKAVGAFGQGPYNASQADLACAAWAYDMEANECEE